MCVCPFLYTLFCPTRNIWPCTGNTNIVTQTCTRMCVSVLVMRAYRVFLYVHPHMFLHHILVILFCLFLLHAVLLVFLVVPILLQHLFYFFCFSEMDLLSYMHQHVPPPPWLYQTLGQIVAAACDKQRSAQLALAQCQLSSKHMFKYISRHSRHLRLA